MEIGERLQLSESDRWLVVFRKPGQRLDDAGYALVAATWHCSLRVICLL